MDVARMKPTGRREAPTDDRLHEIRGICERPRIALRSMRATARNAKARPMTLQIVTLREHPDLRAAIFADAMQYSIWPEYMRHDPVADLYFARDALDHYLDFVLVGLDDGHVVARAFSVPFC